MLIAVPLGIGCAIYLNQYATGRVAAVLRLVTDVMLGIPTIVTGAFVYALWVDRVRLLRLRRRASPWRS